MIALLLASLAMQTAPAPVPTPATALATSPAPVDPARVAAAARLIDLMKMDATLDGLFVQLAPSFAQSVIGVLATNVETKAVIDRIVTAAPDNRDRMVAILSQEFLISVKRQYPAFKQSMAREYAAAFDLSELNAIIAFYSSGPGAKAMTVLPQLQARLSTAGQVIGRNAGQEAGMRAFQRIEQEMLPKQKKPAT